MDNRIKSLAMSKILNNDYCVDKKNKSYINVNQQKIYILEEKNIKKEILYLKLKLISFLEKINWSKENVNSTQIMTISENINVPPFLCRDLINNL